MVHHQQLPHALVADAVLTWQDERVGEELLADGADQLPLDVLDGNLVTKQGHQNSHIRHSGEDQQETHQPEKKLQL